MIWDLSEGSSRGSWVDVWDDAARRWCLWGLAGVTAAARCGAEDHGGNAGAEAVDRGPPVLRSHAALWVRHLRLHPLGRHQRSPSVQREHWGEGTSLWCLFDVKWVQEKSLFLTPGWALMSSVENSLFKFNDQMICYVRLTSVNSWLVCVWVLAQVRHWHTTSINTNGSQHKQMMPLAEQTKATRLKQNTLVPITPVIWLKMCFIFKLFNPISRVLIWCI